MEILNLCDINDEAKNIYYKELLKYFPEDQIVSYGYDPKMHPGEFILSLMGIKYDLIVGHGFGGLLALVIGRAIGAKTILINPMYPASRYWSAFLPDYEYKSFLEKITEREICWDTYGATTENVFLILGRDDDLIDTATTDKYLTRGNSFYVEGGHWPSGDDFVLKFGELTGGIEPDGGIIDAKEDQAFAAISEFIQIQIKAERNLMYLHSYREEDTGMLTKVSKRYLCSLEESAGKKCRYSTADSLPLGGNDIREHFKDLDFLVIDKIVGIVLNDEICRSIWIACDEVTSRGGKVLLLSDSHAADLFQENAELMNLIYSGVIKEIWFREMEGIKSGGIRISFDSSDSRDTRPFEDLYRTVIIDEIKTRYGNLAIRWHSPDLDERILFVYYKDDQWFYDSRDGWCSDTQAKAVLRAAVDKFVDDAKSTDHDAHHFFGWGW